MKTFLIIFLVLLALFTFAILGVFYFMRKGMKFIKRMATGDVSDEEFQRMANKYYRKENDYRNQFDDDYFKGTGKQQQGPRQQQDRQQQQGHTTRTADGITIVDRRAPGQAEKKIFAHDEGEYVDYTEN